MSGPAKLLICGDAPGEREVQAGRPFAGPNEMELNRMLGEAGLSSSSAFFTNLVRHRPPWNDMDRLIPTTKKAITTEMVLLRDRWVMPSVVAGWALLQREIELCRPNVILALGNAAMWALTGKWGLKNYRGSMLETDEGIRVIPSWHPSSVIKQWSLRAIVVQDMRRAAREVGGERVERPNYRTQIRPRFDEAMATLNQLLTSLDQSPNGLRLSVDIETSYGHIMCLGIAWSRLDAICIPFVEIQRGGASYWPEWDEARIVHMLYRVLTHPNCRVIWHNGLFDAQYIFRAWHFIPRHSMDSMIAQHSCFSTMQKSLDFVSALYANHHVYWKGLARELHRGGGTKLDD